MSFPARGKIVKEFVAAQRTICRGVLEIMYDKACPTIPRQAAACCWILPRGNPAWPPLALMIKAGLGISCSMIKSGVVGSFKYIFVLFDPSSTDRVWIVFPPQRVLIHCPIL